MVREYSGMENTGGLSLTSLTVTMTSHVVDRTGSPLSVITYTISVEGEGRLVHHLAPCPLVFLGVY